MSNHLKARSVDKMIAGAIDSEMGARLIPTLVALEQLRALLDGNDEVFIPGIVVAGAQSAGKSSVLEALAGMKLPRGQNITTRVPLILSLQQVQGARTHALISSEAKMSDAKKIDVSDVGSEIEAFTAKLAGAGTGVCHTPIYLRIVRSSGPTMTLIDLPGITHNSEDQTQDIHAETVSLVKKYIENENMVILVVVPAMDDFANAEAIALAKRYDPEGRRTLGVVTKADNVQTGCGIKAKLRMDPGHVQLQLGFIAVVNRTPVEVENDTPAEEVRARERRFFKTNSEVAGLEKEYWGIDTLVERIVGIQADRVQAFIPDFVRHAKKRIKELNAELSMMPKTFADDNQRWDVFREVLTDVRDKLKDMLLIGSDGMAGGEDLHVVPHVTDIYRTYANGIRKDVIPDVFSDKYYETVRDALERVDGTALSDLLAGRVFNVLYRKVFVDELEPHSHDMVGRVRTYMQSILQNLFEDACQAYPALLNEVKTSLVDEFMDAKEEQASEAVLNVVKGELGWVFTQDSAYMTTIANVRHMVDNVRVYEAVSQATADAGLKSFWSPVIATAVGDVPEAFIKKLIACTEAKDEDIRNLQVSIFAYTDVVCRRVSDVIPKQVHYFLVENLCDGLVRSMLKKATSTDLEAWFAEDIKILHRRKEITRKLSQFQEGVKILDVARSMV